MDSSQDSSIVRRLGRFIGFLGLAAAAVAISVYAAQREDGTQHAEQPSKSQPDSTPQAAPEGDLQEQASKASDKTQELASEVGDDTQEQSPETRDDTQDLTSSADSDPQEESSEIKNSAQKEGAEPEDSSSDEDTTVQRTHDDTTVQSLENLTVGELYRLAQRHDIVGRSNMRKAQLLEALKTEGIEQAES